MGIMLVALSTTAQDIYKYIPLKSYGEIPKDFLELKAAKFKKEVAELDKSEKRRTRKTKEDYLLKSNYYVDDVLSSGRVVFNDPISRLCKKVLKEVLKSDPKLYKAIRIYTIKSTIVNAFTTGDGIIFISTGYFTSCQFLFQ